MATILVLAFVWNGLGQSESERLLKISSRPYPGWFELRGQSINDRVYSLQSSSNLVDWTTIAILHENPFAFIDPASAIYRRRFYRFADAAKTEADDWKNHIVLPDDPFLSPDEGNGQIRWIKFAVKFDEPYRVFYQDSTKYRFHSDFARRRLPPFQGMTADFFDAVALHTNKQQVILGAVLFPRRSSRDAAGQQFENFAEYGIQFVGLDPYPAETVRSLFELVSSTIHAPPGTKAFYLPTYEQARAAERDRAFLEANGIAVSSTERWVTGNSCYAFGWAIGRLKFIASPDIVAAYIEGRLLSQDILLTDGVPAEIPFVAGIITLSPATPNSHVAILSRTFGIPFVYVANQAERDRLQTLHGREIALRAYSGFVRDSSGLNPGSQIDITDVEGILEPAIHAEILALKTPQPIQLVSKAAFGAISVSTDKLAPSDIRFFGGKAANFGLLRQAIPSNSPVAIAFSFGLYDAFLDQILPGGQTLRTEISKRLSIYTYPPNISALKADLASVRDLITKTARFSPAQQEQIVSALAIFDAAQNIRFRSSSNVEDGETFTGAGLHDSFSGCLSDDLDFDDDGPSVCDPSEPQERGVFRATQKVYASFYNDDAFLERLRHQVDESVVGMGVLVHHSFPDEQEAANGVATVRKLGDSANLEIQLVTQAGAVSVTNPEGSAKPEVVSATKTLANTYLTLSERSGLVTLGDTVMTWEADYRGLIDLVADVTAAFQNTHPGKTNFLLDLEYKKIKPDKLIVKQVREVPLPNAAPGVIPFLLAETVTYCNIQGTLFRRVGDQVFANHRLKSRLTLSTKNSRLNNVNVTQGFISEARFEYLDAGEIKTLTGPVSSWPNASHLVNADRQTHLWLITDRWTVNTAVGLRRYELESSLPQTVSAAEGALFRLTDAPLQLSAVYSSPAPVLDAALVVTNEAVNLWPCPATTPESLLQRRMIDTTNGWSIQTSYYWPPRGVEEHSWLIRFVETKITGLTSVPIVLKGYFSQTYGSWHHNIREQFLFEPRLEPRILEASLNELKAANIQLIFVEWQLFQQQVGSIQVLGFDGKFRQVN